MDPIHPILPTDRGLPAIPPVQREQRVGPRDGNARREDRDRPPRRRAPHEPGGEDDDTPLIDVTA
jgi:hypothetical protein